MKSFSRNELYAIVKRSNGSSFDEKLDQMEKELLRTYSETDPLKTDAKRKLVAFKHQYKKKWLAARNTSKRFEENNHDWLTGVVLLPTPGN